MKELMMVFYIFFWYEIDVTELFRERLDLHIKTEEFEAIWSNIIEKMYEESIKKLQNAILK